MLINVPCGCTAVLYYLQFFLTKYDSLKTLLFSFTPCTQSFCVILKMGALALLIFVSIIRVYGNDCFGV
jgi:hypothetical protein